MTTPHPSDCDCMVCLTDMTQSREQPTPGPWHRGLRRAAGRIEIKNADGNLIAMVNGWPEAEANIRLICAARDLRDALRELIECKDMKDRLRSYEFGSTQEMAALAEEYDRRKPAAWDAARVALAKAVRP